MSVFFLQVSRCEKFGYGLMVTQVAATAPGVAALHKSGTETFIRANTFQHYAGARNNLGNKAARITVGIEQHRKRLLFQISG